jgi:hypothetical protein
MDTNEAQRPIIIAIIITFIIAFWLGFFMGWLITGREVSPAPLTDSSEDLTEETSLLESGNEATEEGSFTAENKENTLNVRNQSAGARALVASLTLAREGWLVIHEESDGRPGNVLGAAWFPAGMHEAVQVELLRTMESGKRYYAMLHGETKGDGEAEIDHTFDLKNDLPLQNAQDKIIHVAFETIASPN